MDPKEVAYRRVNIPQTDHKLCVLSAENSAEASADQSHGYDLSNFQKCGEISGSQVFFEKVKDIFDVPAEIAL